MKDYINQFQEFSQLNDAAKLDFISVARLQHFKKGEVILPVGNVCRDLYFLETGLVKIFSFKCDKEFIMRFFSESQIFFSVRQLLNENALYLYHFCAGRFTGYSNQLY